MENSLKFFRPRLCIIYEKPNLRSHSFNFPLLTNSAILPLSIALVNSLMSATSTLGLSTAAKWPPLSWLFQNTMLFATVHSAHHLGTLNTSIKVSREMTNEGEPGLLGILKPQSRHPSVLASSYMLLEIPASCLSNSCRSVQPPMSQE